ncbi:MFS general substrate transporter [Coniochaeta sp. PMI_546]|nr:MFS general substrate transporter [Coniochaeta sp. PMI_546]
METTDVSLEQRTAQAVSGPPPDGGLQAWLQVVGAFSVLVATWGLVNTYGVYQTHYQTVMLTSDSASSISWIGSLQACLLFLGGFVSGPLFDAGHFRAELVGGLFLISFGMFMTSLCETYWQVLLAQGVCVGLGMGFTFLPSAGLVAQYFHKRRAFALGIAGTGSPIGGIIFPIIFSRLLPTVGFGWATRVIAFIVLGLSVLPIIFMRPRIPPSGRIRSLVDNTAWTDFGFMSFTAGLALTFLVLYTAFFYLQVFTELNGISSLDFAPYTVTFLNVGSIAGRLLPTYLADKLGQVNVIIFCTLASAVLVFGWMGIHNLAGVVVFAVLYGVTSGGVVNVAASALMTFSPDMARLGTRMGMAFVVAGVFVLVGTPIAGAILGDFTRVRWLATMGYSAGGLVLGTACMGLARIAKGRGQESWKF